MIIEERKSHELNLESIDNDLRLESVRQNAEKLGWEDFARSVRRNLQEKHHTLEASIRLDVLGSLAFMKAHLPIDKDASLPRKIQCLADGLGENCVLAAHVGGISIKTHDVWVDIGIAEEAIVSCKMGYFGQPLFDAPEALALLKSNEFSKLRDSIAGVLSLIPKEITL
ncbi:hypothetical protein B9Z55_000965 [Caenorhabditis nigoni]|uniref:Uncharacterized protein n=1 Tax=Caenorhabditis nigoni TaxID=1611254 RepID=A0A2G5VVN3_9PELO|nr:hypothetical protein B9Z55_000965 [Caenorhabditis nigoni]